MSPRRMTVLAGCTVVAIALVWWLGDDYGNEARAFLRTLARAF